MDATNGYKRLHGLTIAQLNAVDRLVAGDTDQQAADAVGVNRVTVSKWRLYDPTFQAALNERRQEVFGAATDRLRSLLPKALDTMAVAMDGGNVLAAVTILKAAALDKLPPPAGPTEPEQVLIALVETRMKEKRAARERTRTLDEILNELGNPGCLAQWEAESTAAAWREVEAELAARLNGDGHHADTAAP
ncbi:MAG TPA: hypothetical protein VF278_23495 [Pirellulales bacterium]